MRLHPPFPFFLAATQHKTASIEKDDRFDGEDYDNDLDDIDSLANCYTSKHSVAIDKIYNSTDEVISDFLSGSIYLRRSEGLKMMHTGSQLFIDGEVLGNSKFTEIISFLKASPT